MKNNRHEDLNPKFMTSSLVPVVDMLILSSHERRKHNIGVISVWQILASEPYLYNVNVGDLCLTVYQNCYMQGTNKFLV
jgi:hypothetical protein